MVRKVALPTALVAILSCAQNALCFTTISNVEHTFYGYPDNSPPGPSTAYNCGGRNYTAGGTGTYSDPLTFASAPGEFNKCEIIWDPYTEKYLRMDDTCVECIADWENGKWHIDIWTGSSTVNGGQAQIKCEDALTPDSGHNVIRNGNTGHTPNTAPLFANGKCYTNNVNPSGN